MREISSNNGQDEGEYANLIRYISTYRDRRFSKAPSQVSADDVQDASMKKKQPFFKRLLGGSGGPAELYEVPEEWLNTDIKQGLTSAEVESRRKKTGFNELTTEKENMFIKFIGYFRGPILYGMYCVRLFYDDIKLICGSYGACCPACGWSARLDRFRCHHRYPDA
jgi:H+-transporting ATPase